MKKIYFVRHGESEGNAGELQQTPETLLTKRGLEQAQVIGKRISHISFDKLISSNFKRAIQTADEISKITGKSVTQSDLFFERMRPSEQVGKKKVDNAVSEKLYFEAWLRGEKYKDGESFSELAERAQKALAYLESLPEERIVVVTHGIFLKVIASVILLGKFITPATCDRCIWLLKTSNTGLSEIELKDGVWHIITWNDQAHLG